MGFYAVSDKQRALAKGRMPSWWEVDKNIVGGTPHLVRLLELKASF